TTALETAPVAYIASEEMEEVVVTGRPDAPVSVAIDPLDGSSNIDTNVSIGTIFSILPRSGEASPEADFRQPGSAQLSAGYIIYGPQTALVLTVGEGTHIFTLDPRDGRFKLTEESLRVPAETREFAVNASNYRHWDESFRRYIDDCLEGEEGPRGKNFNMRWVASMVAECQRILMRGGVYLYPGDSREGYRDGRLRLIYEANPIGFLMEQAGGACSTGLTRMLDVEPTEIHQRVPLIFGSAGEVAAVEDYLQAKDLPGENNPLFGQRGLFRS
ncbi:MAG: class 1 fructose-bisphosphatase, partial [bacterium]|nr:class 1 fructose-bisphosphatase [bacterium]